MSLALLKNIERLKAQGIKPSQEYVVQPLITFGVPTTILKRLALS